MNTQPSVRAARRAFVTAVLGSSLALAAGQASAETAVAGVTVHRGVSDAVAAWSRAVEAGDARAVARMNGPHTVAYGVDGKSALGTEAIVANYAGMFDKYTARVEIRDAGWVRQGPLLHSWGLFTLVLTPKAVGEQPVRVDGRFSDLAARVNGRWQYIVDHASASAAR